MKKVILIVVVCALGAAFTSLADAAKRKLAYQSYDGKGGSMKVVDKTTVQINESDTGSMTISRQKKTKTCLMKDEFKLDQDHSLLSWSRSCPEDGTEYMAEKKGDTLLIKGTFMGDPIDKELELGGKYLHIYPKYSLSKFAFSGMRSMKFWAIRRDELSLLPMQAKVKGVEKIIVDGKEVEVVKVYYSIVGKMREKFYHHNYYYRKSDGVFIKKVEHNGRIEELVKEK